MCDATFPLDDNPPMRDATGETLVHGMRTGAFAEATVVHHSQVVRIPVELPFDVASLLACGVITGVGAVANTARVEMGSDVVVFGCGGVGLNSVQGARLAGARTIVAIDLADSKLAAARSFGATHTLNARNDDVVTQVKAITDGRGADYVFVTVGAKPAYDASYALLAKGGAVVLVGMPPSGVMSEIDPSTMAAYSQRILGSKMGASRIAIDIPHLVTLYQHGRLQLDELISGRYPLEQINGAMASVKSGDALRNVIVF
jgi:Zn-dependent alcohol dehydrogenase